MYNFLIVGHGNFASGIKSAIDLLLGENSSIHAQNLNEEITHDEFEKIIIDYVEKYDEMIIFADLLGGSPSQICTRKILELKKSKKQYVISGVSLSLIIDICTQILLVGNTNEVSDIIQEALSNTKDSMSLISLADFE